MSLNPVSACKHTLLPDTVLSVVIHLSEKSLEIVHENSTHVHLHALFLGFQLHCSRLSAQLHIVFRAARPFLAQQANGAYCVCIGLLTGSGHVEHGSDPLHPAVRLFTLWSVLPAHISEASHAL